MIPARPGGLYRPEENGETGGDDVARTLLLIGTRKGCFVAEGDADRRRWKLRGPYCEGWPVYQTAYDEGTGAIYAAAASEWHGSAVWRSLDLGETWTLSSEGLGYDADGGRKVSKISSVAVVGDRVLAGVEAPGIFESRDRGETWSLLTTLSGQPGSEEWDDPGNQPPGHLGISALMSDSGGDDSRFWAIVQGIGLFETGDGGETWTPRNRGLRADWPRPHEEVGFCVHRMVRSPADPDRMYQQNHVGMHRSDDCGLSWVEITEGLPTEFGFAAAAHPHDRDSFYVIPLDPGHGRCMPDGRAAVWRTEDAGESWRRLDRGLPQRNAHVGVLRAAMAIDGDDVPGLYFGTSTGHLFASVDEGESWRELAGYLPPVWSVEVAAVD
jgi:photosystem II stability/assembly factor-like uncharacterized protein